MLYQQKNHNHLLGIPGLSDELLKDHFTLYEGYVKNANEMIEQLSNLDNKSKEYAELKRRFGWEWNGMRLHELYFENISKEKKEFDGGSDLAKKINESFGSLERWEDDFRSTGMARGIGWVILYFDEENDRLINVWINEHDAGHLAGARPLLIMDVFEHAYMKDYGLRRADYINVFMTNVDWHIISERLG